jgi:hypothetical protein
MHISANADLMSVLIYGRKLECLSLSNYSPYFNACGYVSGYPFVPTTGLGYGIVSKQEAKL